jgi:hypothetical protein
MRRKTQPQPKEDAVVPAEILDVSHVFFAKDKPRNIVACGVCGSETIESSTERLCWVCRRLKISAWRDSEQMPAQE